MKWLDATHLESWATRISARVRLSEIVAQLVRASAASISAFDFPNGDSAQRPGYDGRLTAIPSDNYQAFMPEGESVWEFGTRADFYGKANEDYQNRTDSPGSGVETAQTTLVIVTPRIWDRAHPTRAEWEASKRSEGIWKNVRAIDAVALEAWLDLCPAVAASIAREIVGTLPGKGALSTEEYWREYSTQFQPTLREELLTSGRQSQVKEMLQALMGSAQIHRWQGDSIGEVIGFLAASVRTADESIRKFLESRILLVESRDAARQLAGIPNLIFVVKDEAAELTGMLATDHPVILPLGRESIRDASAMRLARPSAVEVSDALKLMGFAVPDCERIALECDRSVTILARRIPSAIAKRPTWHSETALIPALIAGAWDKASKADCSIIAALAGEGYEAYEKRIRGLRQHEDAPLETVGTVWAVRAPVDVFVNLAQLLGDEHFLALQEAVHGVFGHLDPALDLPVERRPFADLHGVALPHSAWLREGLANSLLITAAIGKSCGLQIGGASPQEWVNRVIQDIPGLRDDVRIIASLSRELPLLMEAAPDPLLFALGRLLEGDGVKILPIFQDKRGQFFLFARSPHTGLLWALETIAWDPAYLSRVCVVLTKLSRIDPGGELNNRPLRTLKEILRAWMPGTYAPLRQRLGVLDEVSREDSSVGWKLLVELLPKHDSGGITRKPQYRDAGASLREPLTNGVVLETFHQIIRRAVKLAGYDSDRWRTLLQGIHEFAEDDRQFVCSEFEKSIDHITAVERAALWESVSDIVRHHRAYSSTDWAMRDESIQRLETILEKLKPSDPVLEALWLFEERFPPLRNWNSSTALEEVEELRKSAVRKLADIGGADAVIQLGCRAKAPRYVGFAAGYVFDSVAEIKVLEISALHHAGLDSSFASLLSLAALNRFGAAWSDAVRLSTIEDHLSTDQIIALVLSWPHERTTWDFIDELGKAVSDAYWQSRTPWGIQGGPNDLSYAVERYLAVDRSELVVLGMAIKAEKIAGPLLLKVLDQFERRIEDSPDILRNQSIDFDLRQIFEALQEQPDINEEEIARREYRYLPLMREPRGSKSSSRSLAIEKLMAKNPGFFVQILCDVFFPASERGTERPEPTEQARARANTGWMLLDAFMTIPGLDQNQLNRDILRDWVSIVRKLSTEKDRQAIADQRIGAMLAHVPADPGDHIWPLRGIRDCLEDWKSDQIEKGIEIERMNMRGATFRGPRDGGEQERALARDLRENAKMLDQWPRIHRLLLGLADRWERAADHEDILAKQIELRE